MIRKYALPLAWILVAVMTAAALWRLSRLPDWSRLTMAREDGTASHAASSAFLFICPAIVAFAAIRHALSMRRAQGKPEAVQAVRRFSATLLLAMALISALIQGIILGRSLGLALPYEAIARCFFVALGLLTALFGNRLPKLPWITSRHLPLNDAAIQKVRRLNGIVMVAMGLAFALAGALLTPLHRAVWLTLPLILGGVMGIRVYARWLRQSQIPGAQ